MSSDELVCFDKEGFVLLMDSLREAFGSAGESMVFHMSKQYGKYLIQSKKSSYSNDDQHNQNTVESHLEKVRGLGWGDLVFDEIDWMNGAFNITMNENGFSDYCINGHEGMCYFIKGVMAGTMEEIMGYQINITELTCAKKGDSKCAFKLQRL